MTMSQDPLQRRHEDSRARAARERWIALNAVARAADPGVPIWRANEDTCEEEWPASSAKRQKIAIPSMADLLSVFHNSPDYSKAKVGECYTLSVPKDWAPPKRPDVCSPGEGR